MFSLPTQHRSLVAMPPVHLLRSSSIGCWAAFMFLIAHTAASEPDVRTEEYAQRAQGLLNMQRSAAQYSLAAPDSPQHAFKFHESPILRFSNPVSKTKDGALYLWTNRGRPQAVLKFFTFNNTTYSHAWLSLSERRLLAQRDGNLVWNPLEPGVTFRELPAAPQPAESATERLRQSKFLAEKFTATYTAVHLGADPFELRLLPQPLFRYETDDNDRADGALFAFVQSTTPVGLLLLESRPTQQVRRWHFAFTTLVTGPVSARYADQEVFSHERDSASTDPQKPFILFRSLPVPQD